MATAYDPAKFSAAAVTFAAAAGIASYAAALVIDSGFISLFLLDVSDDIWAVQAVDATDGDPLSLTLLKNPSISSQLAITLARDGFFLSLTTPSTSVTAPPIASPIRHPVAKVGQPTPESVAPAH